MLVGRDCVYSDQPTCGIDHVIRSDSAVLCVHVPGSITPEVQPGDGHRHIYLGAVHAGPFGKGLAQWGRVKVAVI